MIELIELLAILADIAGALVVIAHVRGRHPRALTPSVRAIVIAVRGRETS